MERKYGGGWREKGGRKGALGGEVEEKPVGIG